MLKLVALALFLAVVFRPGAAPPPATSPARGATPTGGSSTQTTVSKGVKIRTLDYYKSKIRLMPPYVDSNYIKYMKFNEQGKTEIHEATDGTISRVEYASELVVTTKRYRDVVIKRIYRSLFEKQSDYHAALGSAFNEIKINGILQMAVEPIKFIPRLYGSYRGSEDGDLVLIYEMIGGRNALEIVREAVLERRQIAESLMVGLLVAESLANLKIRQDDGTIVKMPIVYKAFRLSHFVYNASNQAYIVDCGSSEVLKPNNVGPTMSPPASRAPEIWLGIGYDNAADLFGLGIMMFNMFYRTALSLYQIHPDTVVKVKAKTEAEQLVIDERRKKLILDAMQTPGGVKEVLAMHEGCDVSLLGEDGLDLMSQLLQFNPTDRITFAAAKVHPFFKNLGVTPENVANRSADTRNFDVQTEMIHRHASTAGGKPMPPAAGSAGAAAGSNKTRTKSTVPKTPKQFADAYMPSIEHGLFASKSSASLADQYRISELRQSHFAASPLADSPFNGRAGAGTAEPSPLVLPIRLNDERSSTRVGSSKNSKGLAGSLPSLKTSNLTKSGQSTSNLSKPNDSRDFHADNEGSDGDGEDLDDDGTATPTQTTFKGRRNAFGGPSYKGVPPSYYDNYHEESSTYGVEIEIDDDTSSAASEPLSISDRYRSTTAGGGSRSFPSGQRSQSIAGSSRRGTEEKSGHTTRSGLDNGYSSASSMHSDLEPYGGSNTSMAPSMNGRSQPGRKASATGRSRRTEPSQGSSHASQTIGGSTLRRDQTGYSVDGSRQGEFSAGEYDGEDVSTPRNSQAYAFEEKSRQRAAGRSFSKTGGSRRIASSANGSSNMSRASRPSRTRPDEDYPTVGSQQDEVSTGEYDSENTSATRNSKASSINKNSRQGPTENSFANAGGSRLTRSIIGSVEGNSRMSSSAKPSKTRRPLGTQHDDGYSTGRSRPANSDDEPSDPSTPRVSQVQSFPVGSRTQQLPPPGRHNAKTKPGIYLPGRESFENSSTQSSQSSIHRSMTSRPSKAAQSEKASQDSSKSASASSHAFQPLTGSSAANFGVEGDFESASDYYVTDDDVESSVIHVPPYNSFYAGGGSSGMTHPSVLGTHAGVQSISNTSYIAGQPDDSEAGDSDVDDGNPSDGGLQSRYREVMRRNRQPLGSSKLNQVTSAKSDTDKSTTSAKPKRPLPAAASTAGTSHRSKKRMYGGSVDNSNASQSTGSDYDQPDFISTGTNEADRLPAVQRRRTTAKHNGPSGGSQPSDAVSKPPGKSSNARSNSSVGRTTGTLTPAKPTRTKSGHKAKP